MPDLVARSNIAKKPKNIFQRMKNFEPTRRLPSSRRSAAETYRRNIQEAVARELPRQPRGLNYLEMTGSEVKNIKDLNSREKYIRLKVGEDSNVEFVLRKGQTTQAPGLRLQETEYDLKIMTSQEGVRGLTLQGFMGSLWDIFERIFNECVELYPGEEICFHATHEELDGSLSSSIFELKAENRDACISEIMSRINAWNESSKVGAAIKDIKISTTILKRNLPGNGILLAIGDENLRKKQFSKTRFNGSILYVDSTRDCFFISIYYCLMYNLYLERFKTVNSKAEKLRVHNQLWQVLGTKGEELQK